MAAHALTRAEQRLTEAGLDPAKVHAKAAQIATATSKYWSSVAVLMTALKANYGDIDSDILARESNGDEVWMVARGGTVCTIFLRRSDQPHSAEAFRVERVLRMTK